MVTEAIAKKITLPTEQASILKILRMWVECLQHKYKHIIMIWNKQTNCNNEYNVIQFLTFSVSDVSTQPLFAVQ